ncbi:hypothetical protein C1646_777045 [Rhizophagus diaphanus]|nr:hypothetical protein C1646_777045 [Rhizophagus diaphanus] [Rhizophagus sp. MUCL 43196]
MGVSAVIKKVSASNLTSNIPTEIVSSDSNESSKEQTSKISESSAKLQDTLSSSIKASNKLTKIVFSNSNESASNKLTKFVSSDDKSGKEQTSKVPELSVKFQDTSSSLFIKDFRNKPTGFVSSDDESGKKDYQPSKKKSKKSSSIKASNKSTEVVSSDDKSHQPKKNSKNSKKKFKSKNSEKTSRLETDSSPAAPRKVTYHSLTELPKDTKDNLHVSSQLDINKTFKSQKDLVTKIIISALFKVLDTNAYLVSEDDPIVSKLKKSELNLIMLENAYNSPEESEVDSDNNSNENHIVIRDIK